MIDQIHILVQAGDGGHGCESFYHRNDRKTIPNGGDGGKGGSIIFRADPNAPPLSDLRYRRHLIAEAGGHGGSNNKRGRNAADLVVLVLPGTRLYDRTRNLLVRDSMKAGEEVVVVEGGRGGSGNQGDKEPGPGEKGASLDLEIRCFLPADVAMVGLPNAGKTSILNHFTRAKTKPEEYPFSTRSPELGVFAYSDFEQLTLVDLPSLYAASHEQKGLGNDFLKHLELVQAILYVIDPVSQFAGSLEEGLRIVKDQVRRFNPRFLDLPAAVIVNKIDLPEAKELFLQEKWKAGMEVFAASAKTGEGMAEVETFLKRFLRK